MLEFIRQNKGRTGALLVSGLVVGSLLFTPAGAHVGNRVNHLWKQHIRPKADNRYPPRITRLQYQGSDADATVGDSYELLRTVGNFNKAKGGTRVLLTWNAHASTAGSYCEFQLRVDGRKDTGSRSNNYEGDSAGNAVLYGAESPVSVTARFPNLSSGSHSVEIWVRGSATSCSLNRGNFGQQVLVEEVLAA